MADILIRNLSDAVVNRLKSRAEANGRSLQTEAKMILEQNAMPRLKHAKLSVEAFWEKTDRIRKELEATGREFSDSTELIRKMRDPDV